MGGKILCWQKEAQKWGGGSGGDEGEEEEGVGDGGEGRGPGCGEEFFSRFSAFSMDFDPKKPILIQNPTRQ